MQVVLRTMLEAFCGDQHLRIELHLLLAETLILGLGQNLLQLHIDLPNYTYIYVLFGTLIPTAIQILITLISKGLHMVLLWYAITPCLATYIQSLFL